MFNMRTLCGLQFLLNVVSRILVRRKQVTVQACEVTVDVFVLDDCLDSLDCSLVTLNVQTQGFEAVKTLDFVEAVVDYICQMSGSARRFSASNAGAI